MDCNTLIISVLVPVVSAIIGGIMTLLGVLITLRAERKQAKSERLAAAKPWLFSVSMDQSYPNKQLLEMRDPNSTKTEGFISCNIRNTDNATAILDRVESGNITYKPIAGRILEKDSVTELVIRLSACGEQLKNMKIYVRSIYGEEYEYKIIHPEKLHFEIAE